MLGPGGPASTSRKSDDSDIVITAMIVSVRGRRFSHAAMGWDSAQAADAHARLSAMLPDVTGSCEEELLATGCCSFSACRSVA